MKLSFATIGLLIVFPFVAESLALAQGSSAANAPELPLSHLEFALVQADNGGFKVSRTVTQTEVEEQSYTVKVPYTVKEGDKTRTDYRDETRTRMVPIPKISIETMLVPNEAVSFSSVAGKKITDLAVVNQVLAQPRAAVIRYDQQPMEPYFSAVLQPSLVVMHLDRNKLEPREKSETSSAPDRSAPKPSLDDLFGPGSN